MMMEQESEEGTGERHAVNPQTVSANSIHESKHTERLYGLSEGLNRS